MTDRQRRQCDILSQIITNHTVQSIWFNKTQTCSNFYMTNIIQDIYIAAWQCTSCMETLPWSWPTTDADVDWSEWICWSWCWWTDVITASCSHSKLITSCYQSKDEILTSIRVWHAVEKHIMTSTVQDVIRSSVKPSAETRQWHNEKSDSLVKKSTQW